MAANAAPLHTVWDCRWSRVESPLRTTADRWLCARDGAPYQIAEEGCHACAHWQCTREPAGDGHLAMPRLSVPGRRGLLQALILLNALIFIVCGVVTLTSPLFVPFAAAMWLIAAALAGFAFFAPLPEA